MSFSVMLGSIVNVVSPNGISIVYSANNNPFLSDGRNTGSDNFPEVVSLNQAKSHFDAKTAVFIDARQPDEFQEGHIPGAISLSLLDFDKRYEETKVKMPANHTLIIYCDNVHCDLSARLAYKLIQKGHLYTYIFENGIRHWKIAEYPVESE